MLKPYNKIIKDHNNPVFTNTFRECKMSNNSHRPDSPSSSSSIVTLTNFVKII